MTAAPDKCSSNIIFKTAVERLLAEREDVFFYWIIPDWVTDEQFEWYPQSDRVQYIRAPQSTDRVREYLQVPEVLREALTFYGPCWDFDVLMTMRSVMVPQMRLLMNSPRAIGRWWLKEVWLIDVMPMMDFKPTVPKMVPDVHERATLAGYQAADKVWCISYYEPAQIKKAARRRLQPSEAIKIADKVKTGVTAQFEKIKTKAKKHRFKSGGDRPFGLSFIGRMEKANGIIDIHDTMKKAWIARGDNVKPIVCTVSKVVKEFDEDLIDVRFPPREEFWKICETELDATIYVSQEAAVSLSVLEPIMLGVPCITIRDEPRRTLLGDDYPLYADSLTNVYGVFKALYDDYDYWYGKFAEWQQGWFKETWTRRFEEDLIYTQISASLVEYEQKIQDRLEKLTSLRDNDTVLGLVDAMGDDDVIYEAVQRTGSERFGVMVQKSDPENHASRNLTFMSNWNYYRLGLKLFHGFEDASPQLGHLRRIK